MHDFAYADLAFDGHEPPSILQVAGRDCCVELYTLTKSFSMAGWRVGFLVGTPTSSGAGAPEVLPRLRHVPADPDRRDRDDERARPTIRSRSAGSTSRGGDALCDGLARAGWAVPEADAGRCSSGRRSPSLPRAGLAGVRGEARARGERRRQPRHRLRPRRRRPRSLRPRRERAADRPGRPLARARLLGRAASANLEAAQPLRLLGLDVEPSRPARRAVLPGERDEPLDRRRARPRRPPRRPRPAGSDPAGHAPGRARRVVSRKKTPWTWPCTTTRRRYRPRLAVDGRRASSSGSPRRGSGRDVQPVRRARRCASGSPRYLPSEADAPILLVAEAPGVPRHARLRDPAHVGAPAHGRGPGRGDGDDRPPRARGARARGRRPALERRPDAPRHRDARTGRRRGGRSRRAPFLAALAAGRRVIPVGRLAHAPRRPVRPPPGPRRRSRPSAPASAPRSRRRLDSRWSSSRSGATRSCSRRR